MSADKYFEKAVQAVRKVAESQKESMDMAAEMLVAAVIGDRGIFSFGASHSFMMTEEMVYRTGGLMLVNPIYPHGMNLFIRPLTATSKLERVVGLGAQMLESSPAKEGDVLIISSTSGRNAVAIDMAMAAREKQIKTICITSMDYTRNVTSRHPSGKKVADLCDVVIDNCAPFGDAAVEVPGFAQKVAPLSSLTGIAIVNALVAEVVDRLVKRGVDPPVFVSANLDWGEEHNARLLAENAHRIHYMD